MIELIRQENERLRDLLNKFSAGSLKMAQERDEALLALETFQHESKLFKRFREDVSGGMECLPKCDSVAHEDDCPVANPVEAFRQLRLSLQKSQQRIKLLEDALAGYGKRVQECNGEDDEMPCVSHMAYLEQTAVIQQLAETLLETKRTLVSESGKDFVRAKIDPALASASPWLRKEVEDI